LLLPQIVISWFLSPLAAALIALIIFVAVRTVVLRRANSTDISFYVLPVLILITIWVVSTALQPGCVWLACSCAAAMHSDMFMINVCCACWASASQAVCLAGSQLLSKLQTTGLEHVGLLAQRGMLLVERVHAA
jgi:phosphate/sulfate permease